MAQSRILVLSSPRPAGARLEALDQAILGLDLIPYTSPYFGAQTKCQVEWPQHSHSPTISNPKNENLSINPDELTCF